ncbi:L,D-transpeptidase [Lysobacter sp. S4-A87]|uniref:L,D-transpeptidase n=1 Tax=Lysobacter sp. S4-A87 TaxID=2925843 RepID=UPI001F52BE3C|nr:L,D-transpeptidase [Lysobacter sp. S4-A87]UNK49358.1 L,D-transpeptidase [Lysobacter sp. S4-A87]
MPRFTPRLLAASLSLLLCVTAHAAVPSWGARESSPANTPPTQLKPGQWIWGGDNRAGPLAVVVSLTEQRAYVYRNGIPIGVSTVSTGRKGYETPTGVFTILQKDKDHRSSKYNAAPMPYMQRLTWDGVALHAGGLPGYPESHGCVHLPSEFARLLFGSSNMGMTVVVSQEGKSPEDIVHPGALSPIDPHTGAEAAIPPLENGQKYRWRPEISTEGPVSILLSGADERVIVYRNGIEIGRSRVLIRNPEQPLGTHAYIVKEGYLPGDNPLLPGTQMPNWSAIGIPGGTDPSGMLLGPETINRVVIPHDFVAAVLPLLSPGVVMLVTDARMTEDTTGGAPVQVLDSDPPET